MEEKILARKRKNNMRLYPIYKMIGLDWIFYYGVRVLFLTQVKNISPSDIVLSGSVYAFFYIIFQISNSILIDKIGKGKGIVLGQTLNFIAMCMILYCPNFAWLLLAQITCAMGFGLKGISESSLLNSSLPKSKMKSEIFSKIDSGGYSKFCFIGASSVLISGFLYAVNPYIPIIMCLCANFIAILIARNFIDIEEVTKSNEGNETKKITVSDLKEDFKFIFKSTRLRTLLIMLGVLWGIIDVYATYQETLLKELNIPSYYIGFMLAGFQMLVGVFSKNSNEFNRKHKNHTLTYIGLMLTIGSIALGIITIFKIPFEIQLMIVTFVFIARAYGKGLYQVLKKRYMNNFSDNKILPRIYSVNGITCNIARMLIGIIASMLLKITTLANSLLILGLLCTGMVIFLAFYSKSRLGLKPEEYRKEDIKRIETV